jgi:hypothetical protein
MATEPALVPVDTTLEPRPMTTSGSRSRAGPLRIAVALLATDGSAHRLVVTLATLAAAVGMLASAYIHLHLYDIAYRQIPTIGPLFLLQGLSSIVLAVVASIIRRVWTALIGAGAMIATLAGFLISVNYGLFGFQDSFTGINAVGAFVIEISSALLFLVAVVFSITGRATRSEPSR